MRKMPAVEIPNFNLELLMGPHVFVLQKCMSNTNGILEKNGIVFISQYHRGGLRRFIL